MDEKEILMSKFKICLWIDDLREPPDSSWTVARNSETALLYLDGIRNDPSIELEAISFDHDLGQDDTTRPVMMWLCENEFWPNKVLFHTMNPIGRVWLEGTAKRYAPCTTKVVCGR